MDINDFRGVITAVTLFAFIGLSIWAFSKRRKDDFRASAELPLEDDNYISDNTRENN
jgi:cytochrome c oxidase cbb3-type subunit 4